MWFGNAHLEVDGESLSVTVPNRFAVDWIHKHFRGDLQQAAVEELGEELAIDLRVDPQLSKRDGSARPSDGAAGTTTPRSKRSRPQRRLRHSLDRFIVGPSNELAYAAVRGLGDSPETASNPLFVHGSSGVGKTHLLQGVCERLSQTRPQWRWEYTTAEQFTNDFVQAVRNSTLHRFRQRLRQLDLLAVDDVHFLSNKKGTQTEFLHTFDAIDLKGAKVVIASDAHPKVIQALSKALASRFVSGMLVGIDPPETETRVRIVQAMAARRGLNVTDSVAQSVAESADGSVRELEGTLTKLKALADLDGKGSGEDRPIGHNIAARLWAASAPTTARPIRFEQIVEAVCEHLQIDRSVAIGQSRHRRAVLARSLIVYLARELTPLSFPELAAELNRSNHSTIVTAAKRVHRQVVNRQPVQGSTCVANTTMDTLTNLLRNRICQKAAQAA